jgi:hypothetical protein
MIVANPVIPERHSNAQPLAARLLDRLGAAQFADLRQCDQSLREGSASLSYNAVWWYAVHGGLVSEDLNPQLLRALSLEHAAAPVLHAVALVVAIWSVPLSFIPLGLVYFVFALPRVTERWAAKGSR